MSVEGDFYTVDEIRYFSRFVSNSLQEKYKLTIECRDLPSNIIVTARKELENQDRSARRENDLYAKLYRFKEDQYELIHLPDDRITQVSSRFRNKVDLYEEENKLHYKVCDFIQKLGEKAFERDLEYGAISKATINIIIFKACHFARLYFSVDVYEEGKMFYKNYYIATACLLLASKMNDRQSVRDPVSIVEKHLRLISSANTLPDVDYIAEVCVEILRAEQNVLSTIGFQLEFVTPYQSVVNIVAGIRKSLLYRRENSIMRTCSQQEVDQIKSKIFFRLFDKFLIFAFVHTRISICASVNTICKIVGLLTLSRLDILPSSESSFDGTKVSDQEFIGYLMNYLDLPLNVKTFDLALHVCRVFNVKPASEFREEVRKEFKVTIDNRSDSWQHCLSNFRKALLNGDSKHGSYNSKDTESPNSMIKPSPLSSIDPSSPYLYSVAKHSPSDFHNRHGTKRKRDSQVNSESLSALLNCDQPQDDDQRSFEDVSDGSLSNANTQIHSIIASNNTTEGKGLLDATNASTPLIENVVHDETHEEINFCVKKPRTSTQEDEDQKNLARQPNRCEENVITVDISTSCEGNCSPPKEKEIENFDHSSSTTSPSTTNTASIGSPENENGSPFKSTGSLETCPVDPGIIMNVP